MRRLFMLFAVAGSLAVGPAGSASALSEGQSVNRPSDASVTSVDRFARLPIHVQPNGRYWS